MRWTHTYLWQEIFNKSTILKLKTFQYANWITPLYRAVCCEIVSHCFSPPFLPTPYPRTMCKSEFTRISDLISRKRYGHLDVYYFSGI